MSAAFPLLTRSVLLTTVLVLLSRGRDESRPPVRQDGFEPRMEAIAAEALRGGVVSLVVAIDVGGELAFARGWGSPDLGDGAPPDGDTSLEAGPLLGSFLVVDALGLADSDRLDLATPVEKILPELATGAPGVLVDHLLTHTSGLSDYGDFLRARGHVGRLEAAPVLGWLAQGPLESAPGTCARVSATDDLLLGLVIERRTETGVQERLARLFERAGMLDTGWRVGVARPPILDVEQEFAGGLETLGDRPLPFGGEDLCTTARDLLRFERALVDGRLLERSGRERLATATRLRDGTELAWGRGLSLTRLDDVPRHSCGGGIAGERLQLAYYPTFDVTLVVAAHGAAPPVAALGARIARAFLDLEEPAVLDLPLDASAVERHVGDYYADCLGMSVLEEDAHLVLRSPSGLRRVLLFQGEENFVVRDDPDVRLTFELAGERVIAFVLREHGVRQRAVRMY